MVKRFGCIAVTLAALVGVLVPLTSGAAHAGSWTGSHEEFVVGTDFRAVTGPVAWSYGYLAAPGNSTVILTMRDTATGWSWQDFQSSYCPSQFPNCSFSGRTDVPRGFQLVSVVTSAMPSDGVRSPQSAWIYMPLEWLHCNC